MNEDEENCDHGGRELSAYMGKRERVRGRVRERGKERERESDRRNREQASQETTLKDSVAKDGLQKDHPSLLGLLEFIRKILEQ